MRERSTAVSQCLNIPDGREHPRQEDEAVEEELQQWRPSLDLLQLDQLEWKNG